MEGKMSMQSGAGRPPWGRVLLVVWVVAVVLSTGLVRGGCNEVFAPGAADAGPGSDAGSLLYSACGECECVGCCQHCPNSRGIYIGRGGSYCLDVPGPAWFCPEGWVTESDGGVRLAGRRVRADVAADGGVMAGESSLELLVEASLHGAPVTLVGVAAEVGEPIFEVKDAPGTESQFIDGGVGLELTLKEGQTPLLVMKMERAEDEFVAESCPQGERLPSYRVLFRSYDAPPGAEDSWVNYCQDEPWDSALVPSDKPLGMYRAFFLPGVEVSGKSAWSKRVGPADAQRVTMACGTGAIATCMRWGFRPWEADAGADVDRHLEVFGSCLQAKRAAYFVRFEDLNAYAQDGTRFGIHEIESPTRSCERATYEALAQQQPASSEAIEAVWTREGAECLNLPHLRAPGLLLPDKGLPGCTGSGLDVALDKGYLVTTPVSSSLVPSGAGPSVAQ